MIADLFVDLAWPISPMDFFVKQFDTCINLDKTLITLNAKNGREIQWRHIGWWRQSSLAKCTGRWHVDSLPVKKKVLPTRESTNVFQMEFHSKMMNSLDWQQCMKWLWLKKSKQTCEFDWVSSDSLMDSSLTIPSSPDVVWYLCSSAKEAGALPANTSGGDGVVERHLALRLAPDEVEAAACGGESPLLLTLPRQEKAPLLLLLLWLLCQAASSVDAISQPINQFISWTRRSWRTEIINTDPPNAWFRITRRPAYATTPTPKQMPRVSVATYAPARDQVSFIIIHFFTQSLIIWPLQLRRWPPRRRPWWLRFVTHLILGGRSLRNDPVFNATKCSNDET